MGLNSYSGRTLAYPLGFADFLVCSPYVALLCLKLAPDTARLLTSIKVPGEKTDLDSKHVTLIYLGKELELEAILLAIQVTYQTLASWTPFVLRTRLATAFPPSPEGKYPIIARIESDDLHEMQGALREAFDEEGVPYSNKWPEYRPHCTLSYAEEDMEPFKFPPVTWSCTEVVLWGGDEGETDLICRFPLSLMTKAASVQGGLRNYVQAVMFAERYSSRKPKSRM